MRCTNTKFNVETGEPAVIPVEKPAVRLDEGLLEEILSQVREEGVVIVHCSYTSEFGESIRIWNSTFLIDKGSGSRSEMLHALNITIAPVWMAVPGGTTARFTLIFAALPKTCEIFDLFEDIPQSGGFMVQGIRRNKSDVYNVVIG
jgi:hypothetical protein